MRKIRKTRYPLDQSPFFKLNNKRKLATLLNSSVKQLNVLLSKKTNYNVFTDNKRRIEEPKTQMKAIHKRIQILLNRFETPDYLHSSIKGRSYVSNAKSHRSGEVVRKIDLKRCYPSTTFGHILRFFRDDMKCSLDVATLLTSITTFENHLPTGSPVSPILCFYAHRKLFDCISELASENNIIFTCYVDDLTFSGVDIKGDFMHKVRRLIRKSDMVGHKEKYYRQNKFMEITGVGLRKGQLLLPNRRQKKIYELWKITMMTDEIDKKRELLKKLIGSVSEAGQIEERFKNKSNYLTNLQKKIK